MATNINKRINGVKCRFMILWVLIYTETLTYGEKHTLNKIYGLKHILKHLLVEANTHLQEIVKISNIN